MNRYRRRKRIEEKNTSLIKWVIDILIIVVVVFVITRYVGERTSIIGKSMEPSLHEKDQVVINKVSYKFKDPERFDVIIFTHEDQHLVKRIIGLPGETVQIKDGKIYINGEELEEDYGREPSILDYGVAIEPIYLMPDEYFVLGDNRNGSNDSRNSVIGNIERENIVGKAWLRIWPFDNIGFIKH